MDLNPKADWRSFMKSLVITVILIFSCSISASALAAGYLKFKGIEGEATDKEHQGWINLESYEWGMSRPSSSATGQSRRRGAATIEDLTFVKELDTSSLRLTDYLAKGRITPLVELHLHGPGPTEGDEGPYLVYRLSNVSVSSYHISWASDERPTESVSINFEGIEAVYAPQEGRPVEWAYNVEGNR